MLGKLALQRTNVRFTHLTALAVMAALVVGLFGLMGSASAAALGNCEVSPAVNYLIVGDTCVLANTAASSVTTTSDPSVASIPETEEDNMSVTAAGLGSATVKVDDVTDSSDRTYNIVVLGAPTLEITFDDSDATVKAGTEVEVGIRVRGTGNTAAVAVTLKAPATGVYFLTDTDNGTTSQVSTVSATPDTALTEGSDESTHKLQTAGAPEGEYVITATLAADVGLDAQHMLKRGNYTKVLNIGDAGKGLASATLSLAPGETANAVAGGADRVNLVVEGKNSLGASANPEDVNSVLVYALGGNIRIGSATTDTPNFAQLDEAEANLDADSSNDTDQVVKAKTSFTVSKATAGTVTVRVNLIGGAAGSPESEDIVLTFAGSATAISVGEASDRLGQRGDSITLEVTAEDKQGNTANVNASAITAVLKDADGEPARHLKVTDMQKFTDTNDNGSKDGKEKDVDTAVIVTVASTDDKTNKAAAGEYTVEVTLNNDAKTKQSATFTVVGGVDSVMLDVSEPDDRGRIMVTATASDAGGNPVADKTPVTFSTADQRGDFDPVLHVVRGTAETKSGVATGTYVEIGPGRATIIVTVGTGPGAVTEIARHVSEYGAEEPEAMPEEEASVSCLSNLSGFSTWSCGVESSAAEIFGLVSGRGASAVHLWNGSEWVRYSVVEGAMVPGSSDFMVTEDDILYISN